jgi:CelD/BcsL family acetyltransferase involved in cellulose biosynthesis
LVEKKNVTAHALGSGSTLEITEISKSDRFWAMRDEWDAVLGRSSDDSVFLSWEIMANSVKQIEKERKLRVLCVEDHGKIIAIAPLAQSRRSWLGYEVIEPLALWHSDYTGLILAERAQECLTLFLNYLYQQNDWDFIHLYNVPESSIIFDLLPEVKGSFKFEIRKGASCPYLTIPESLDGLMAGLGPNFRQWLRRSLRRLERDHGRVELKEYAELGSLEEGMQIFIDLHQNRWVSKGKMGVFADQKNREMWFTGARLLAERNWLGLYFLTVNGKPIATQYCVEYNQKTHAGLGGFDISYSSYSPGNLIILKILERCIERKTAEYDFMRGAESYKFDWGAKIRRNLDTKFVSRRFTSRFYNFGINTMKKMKLGKVLDREGERARANYEDFGSEYTGRNPT